MANKLTMKPMEAWSIISSNLAELGRLRSAFAGGYVGHTEAEVSAEVIAFEALRQMQARMDQEGKEDEKDG